MGEPAINLAGTDLHTQFTTTAGTMHEEGCPFCFPKPGRIRLEGEFATAILDGFHVAEGHTLVVPRRHVASLFDLPEHERAAVWAMVNRVRALLMAESRPDGINVGLNDGTAAGQTVMHAHAHVIPRRHGDVADPRGGVRWVVPARAAYWPDGRR